MPQDGREEKQERALPFVLASREFSPDFPVELASRQSPSEEDKGQATQQQHHSQNFPEVTMDRNWNPHWFFFLKHNF